MIKSGFILSLLLISVLLIPTPVTMGDVLTVSDFDFNIDAGNGRVEQLGADYFEIFMQEDYGDTKVWFGFNVTANASGKTIEFKCVQAGNLWSDTWCYPVYSDDHGATWQECDGISIPSEGEGRVLYFEVNPSTDNFLVYAAYPILYTEYEQWITTIGTNENCTVTSDVVSGGEELYLITVTESGASADRPTLWFIAGQDPPETWPQHAARGMVNFLLSANADASRLRADYIWKIVPVSNPNAVRQGLSELNLNSSAGEEINVDWTSPSEAETIAMKADIQNYYDGGGNIVIILDLHAAGGAMDPQGSGIFGLNNKPNGTWAQDWANLVMAGTVYDDNPAITPASQGSSRLRGYAQTLGISGATLELFQCQNLFDWGDLPDPVTLADLYGVGESLALALEDYADRWSGEEEPPPLPPTGDKPKFTEMIDSWSIGASGAWTAYNITAGNGVPKLSTLEIIMTNIDVAAARLMGVRSDGSALNRYIDRCPTDTVGGSAVRMLVNVGANGIIECYAEDYTDVVYYVTGYWENTNFTELIDQVTLTADSDGLDVWTDVDVNTGNSIPLNRTIAVICANARVDGLRQCGVRTDGSAVNRMLDMERAITEGVNTFDTYVQSDPITGIIEVQCEYYTHNWLYLTGYFGANLNFTEAWATKDISAGSWTNLDLTASIKNDTDVVDFTLCNVYTTAVAASHGVRIDGSGLTRIVPQGESIAGGPLGFGMSAQTDALGVVELYSSSINELFKYGGYFTRWAVEEEPPPTPGINKCMKTPTPFEKIMGVLYSDVESINKILK